MNVRKFSPGDARFELAPEQNGDIYTGNLVDERDGVPLTIGYGRYGPNETLQEEIVVHDVMIVLQGSLSVDTDDGTVTAIAGDIVYMPERSWLNLRSHEEGAVTAYVTYPHWRTAGR